MGKKSSQTYRQNKGFRTGNTYTEKGDAYLFRRTFHAGGSESDIKETRKNICGKRKNKAL